MSDLAVKYHFQGGKDQTQNLVVFPSFEFKITNVGELIEAFLHFELACPNCHFRFRDVLDGTPAWVDIKNANAPLPFNRSNEIEVKILKLPVPALFQVASARKSFGHDYPNNGPKKEVHTDDHGKHSSLPGGPSLSNRNSQHNHSSHGEFNLLDSSAVHRDHTAPIKKTPFSFYGEDDPKHPPKPQKPTEVTADFSSKKQQKDAIPQKDIDDLLGHNSNRLSDSLFENDNKASRTATKEADQSPASNQFGDLMDLEVNDYVGRQTYADKKEQELTHQKQKLQSSSVIDPKIKEWAYKNNLPRDLRTLLTNLHEILPNDPVWTRVDLSDILTEGALRKVTLSAIINLHPDKHQDADPVRLYTYQRVVEELNKAFQLHKANKK